VTSSATAFEVPIRAKSMYIKNRDGKPERKRKYKNQSTLSLISI